MISRRSFFALLSGVGTAAASGALATAAAAAMDTAPPPPSQPDSAHQTGGWTRHEAMCEALARYVGSEAYDSWFRAMEFEAYEDGVLTVSLPVRFLQKWVRTHYQYALLQSARESYGPLTRVEVLLRRYDRSIGHKVLSA